MRHMLYYVEARRSGSMRDKNDAETGLHHLAHAICCAMFITELEIEATVTSISTKVLGKVALSAHEFNSLTTSSAVETNVDYAHHLK